VVAAGPRTLDNDQQQTILVIPARLQSSESIEGTEDRAGLVVNQASHIEHNVEISSPEESPDSNEHHTSEIIRRPNEDDEIKRPHINTETYRTKGASLRVRIVTPKIITLVTSATENPP
jgi:hypothetical protein